MKKKQVITGLTAAALIAGTAVPGAFAAQVTSSGAMTLTVGSPYLMNNGTSSLIDAQGTTPVVESPGSVSYTHLDVYKRQVVEVEQLALFVGQHLAVEVEQEAKFQVIVFHGNLLFCKG